MPEVKADSAETCRLLDQLQGGDLQALDRLLDTVADVAKDMRDEGTKAIQSTSIMLVGGSFFIALLNLFLSKTRTSGRAESGPSPESVLTSSHPPQRQPPPSQEVFGVRSLH